MLTQLVARDFGAGARRFLNYLPIHPRSAHAFCGRWETNALLIQTHVRRRVTRPEIPVTYLNFHGCQGHLALWKPTDV
jgi:hypothetical protein